jgi:hypothetical protein
MLLSFIVVVFVGHKFFRDPQDKSFLAVLVVFADLAFVACILSASNLSALDGREWDGRWFSLFPSCLLLTYALWTVLCVAFAGMLYMKIRKSDKAEDDAYQRQMDEESPKKMGANDERDPAAPPLA